MTDHSIKGKTAIIADGAKNLGGLIGTPDAEPDVFPPYAGKDIAKNLSVFS